MPEWKVSPLSHTTHILALFPWPCCLDDTLTTIPLYKTMPLMMTLIWEMRKEEVVEGGRDLKVNQSLLDYGASCAFWELPLPK